MVIIEGEKYRGGVIIMLSPHLNSSEVMPMLNRSIGGLRRWAVQARTRAELAVVVEERGGVVVIIEAEEKRGGVIVMLNPHLKSSGVNPMLNRAVGGLRWWDPRMWAVQERVRVALAVVVEERGGVAVIIEGEEKRGGVGQGRVRGLLHHLYSVSPRDFHLNA